LIIKLLHQCGQPPTWADAQRQGADAAWSTLTVTMSDGGCGCAPAYDVDHEVLCHIESIQGNKNLVITY
jgi:hypothetical protein